MHRSYGMEEMHRDSVVEIANELANVWRCMNGLMQYGISIYFDLYAL
jgi:hypothetical protein